MKKTKLLIPALSIASVGAVVTPMLTSCSKGIEMHDMTEKYTPSITPYVPTETEAEGVTSEDAQKIYIEAVSKNLNILKEDALYSFCGAFGSSNKDTNKQYLGVQINSIDKTNKTVDFTAVMHSITESSENASESGDATITMNITKAKILDFQYTNNEWTFGMGGTEQTAWGDMQAKLKVTGWMEISESDTKVTFSGKEHTFDKNTDSAKFEEGSEAYILWSVFYGMVCAAPYRSYYLKNLPAAK